ncbi:Flp pilus assembly protein CpaB [Altericroceibacterium spongiae]|uniref:Flp pilus assembly protein CpaB n=1 Tax=Altericroceibacterium spongiae TaxID=2320269 RepID=A0A420EKC0_9SPHN|nr:Flp pilus assembly protein CpaB [Altericroceibacterium spongiae]RKF21123.1 Flp pilus assembly protein CpaB [Altericroceibacterium spongiae]
MDKRKLILLVGALIVAIGTALAARSLLTGSSAPLAEAASTVPAGPKVLVAKRALPVGTILTAESVAYQEWPQKLMKDVYFTEGADDMADLLGTVVRYPVTAGEPVTKGSLVAPGDRGFLAAALGPGMRAVTVPVSENTGVAGFVFPGDRVDLVLSQTIKEGQGQAFNTAETILRNIRVLATDRSTSSGKTEDGMTEVRGFSNVTLEVTPRIAEKVAVAQNVGTITLSLRSIADNQSELEQALASGEIELPADATPEEEERLLKTALSYPHDGQSSYVTGGDISRYQPSTMPAPAPSRPPLQPVVMGSQPTNDTAAPRISGPVVRVSRGNNTVIVPVGKDSK